MTVIVQVKSYYDLHYDLYYDLHYGVCIIILSNLITKNFMGYNNS